MGSHAHKTPNTPEITSDDVSAKLEEIEHLVQEFHRLQVHYGEELESEGLREEVEAIERWAESYRRGLKAAVKISESGHEMLDDVRKRLQLAADELTRMASESPNATPRSEEKKAEAFLEATRSVDAILPAVDNAVTHSDEPDTAPNPKKENE